MADSLIDVSCRLKTAEPRRGLISEARLYPKVNANVGHVIEFYKEFAVILDLTKPKNDKTHRFKGGLSIMLVAGVGFEPTTFRL